jgi:DNA-binding NarL/FixJ family response regulator
MNLSAKTNGSAPGRQPQPALNNGRPIRVVLVDDHLLVRWHNRRQLEEIPSVQVVGEAADGFEAVALTRTLAPDLVCMDICMPGLDGIEATRRIRAECPRVRVLILSSHEEQSFHRDALAAGAHGYAIKGDGTQRLAAAIEQVLRPQ